MADRYLLESGAPDGYLLEDGSGVLLLEGTTASQSCRFVSNASAPQVANYALVVGAGIIFASAMGLQGQANASEYRFGGHAAATHNAEAAKTQVWKSQRTPPAVASAVPAFTSAEEQKYVNSPPSVFRSQPAAPAVTVGPVPPLIVSASQGDPSQIAPVLWKSQPAAAAPPASSLLGVFIRSAPEAVDLSISGWSLEPASLAQGPVPPLTVAPPQTNPTQIPAIVWTSVLTPIAAQSGTANSSEYRWGTHALAIHDAEGRKSQLWPSVPTPPVVTGDLGAFVLTVPQAIDLTQQGSIFSPITTPPVQGSVPAFTLGGQPQENPYQISALTWAPLEFGVAPPAPPTTDASGGFLTDSSLSGWRKRRRPHEEAYLRERGVGPEAAQIIADVAARQAEDLHLDEQQRFEELTRELKLKEVQFDGRYLELLNTERERLIDAEIEHLLSQTALQRKQQQQILLLLMTLA